jgi:hypothetical protein
MHKLTCTLIFLFAAINAQAQESDSTKAGRYGFFLIGPIEFASVQAPDLNRQLIANGFSPANYPKAALGFGIQIFSNRYVTTLSFNKMTKKSETPNSITEVEYRSTSFNLGYRLTRSKRYAVYPYLGFKGSGLHYVYREKVPDPTSFGSYLSTNYKYKELNNSMAMLDLGLGVSYQKTLLVNLRFGYLPPRSKVQWNGNGNFKNYLNSGPDIQYPYYFILNMGIGGMSSNKKVSRPGRQTRNI